MLFVCAGNTGRSVSAEALTRGYLRSRNLHAEVFSRGLAVDPVSRHAEGPAQALLARRGVDLSRHLARGLGEKDVAEADVVLCVTAEIRDETAARHPAARSKVFSLAQYCGLGADLQDAFGKPFSVYEAMLTQLELQIPALVSRALAEFAAQRR